MPTTKDLWTDCPRCGGRASVEVSLGDRVEHPPEFIVIEVNLGPLVCAGCGFTIDTRIAP